MRVLPNKTLQHIHYGGCVSADDFSYYNVFQDRAFSPRIIMGPMCTSHDTMPQEYPTFARGDFRCAALRVEGADGRSVNELQYKSHEAFQGKVHIPGMPQLDANTESVETLAITLEDVIVGYEVVLYYSVFEEADIITRTVKVVNNTDNAVVIKNIASLSVDFETADFELISLEGSWARERHIARRPLCQGTTSIESRRGSSSHQMNPFLALAGKSADEHHGEVYGFSLIYSADFKALAELSQYDDIRVQMGLNPETFSWKLASGESFMAPEAMMTYSASGLNGMSQNFHKACRKHLGKCADSTVVHPIVINNWEATYFNMSDEIIKEFLDNCKGLGIDTFVLDDGWFGRRSDDSSSLGDWFVDDTKFSNGLHNVVNYCREIGMKFGIWFEPEMISKRSRLFENHPDWCIHYRDVEPIPSRNQLVLDMSRNEVVDYIFEEMAKIIREYKVSYIKWDFNRNLTDLGSATLPADRQMEYTHRYILGVYSLMQKLNNAFPEVFFEGCSGGGGRFDFGILYYMPQIWTSDDTDAVERMKIQYGTSMVYPTSTMVAHVSACPNHQTGRTVSFDTRGEVAQMCNYGYELHVGKLAEEEKEKIKMQIERHRALDELVQKGTYYRLRSPFEAILCAWELVSEDKARAYVCAAFQSAMPNAKTTYLKVRGLNPEATYLVKQLGVKLQGDSLMHAGLPIRMPDAVEYAVLPFDIEKVGER